MRRRQREVSVFSLSMMDVITSGLGAVVVLLVIQSLRAAQVQFDRAAAERDRQAAARLAAAHRGLLDTVAALEGRARSLEGRAEGLEGRARSLEERARDAEAARLELARLRAEEQSRSRAMSEVVGIKADKRRYVLLVDISGSIKHNPETPARYAELVGIFVDVIPEGAGFNVIGFHGEASACCMAWRPNRGFATADAASRRGAKAFIRDTLIPAVDGGTPAVPALREAMAHPGVESILLFTDGSPDNCQDADRPCLMRLADEITAMNKAKVEIHCIGVGQDHYGSPHLAQFLSALASKNKGRYIGMGL